MTVAFVALQFWNTAFHVCTKTGWGCPFWWLSFSSNIAKFVAEWVDWLRCCGLCRLIGLHFSWLLQKENFNLKSKSSKTKQKFKKKKLGDWKCWLFGTACHANCRHWKVHFPKLQKDRRVVKARRRETTKRGEKFPLQLIWKSPLSV